MGTVIGFGIVAVMFGILFVSSLFEDVHPLGALITGVITCTLGYIAVEAYYHLEPCRYDVIHSVRIDSITEEVQVEIEQCSDGKLPGVSEIYLFPPNAFDKF